ncbi:MAG: hypothetical protein VW378_02255 [bacterium]
MTTTFFTPHSLSKAALFQSALLKIDRHNIHSSCDDLYQFITQYPQQSVDVFIYLYERFNATQNNYLRFLIAKLYFKLEQYSMAFLELKILLERKDIASAAYPLLFQLYEKGLFKSEIISIFELSHRDDRDESFLLDYLPKLYVEDKKFDELISFYTELIHISPNDLHLQDKLASAYLRVSRYEDAISTYTAIFSSNSEWRYKVIPQIESFVNEHSDLFSMRYFLIDLYIKQCLPDKALASLSLLNSESSKHAEKGLEYCKHIMDIYPNHFNTLVFSAELYYKLDRYTESVTVLTSAFALNSDNHLVILTLLKKILSQEPSQVSAKLLLCDIYFKQNNLSSYVHILTELIESEYPDLNELHSRINKLKSDDKRALKLKALIYLYQGDARCLSICESLNDSSMSFDISVIVLRYYFKKNMLSKVKDTLKELLLASPFSYDLHDYIKQLHHSAIRNDIQILKRHQPNVQSNRLSFRLGLLHLRQENVLTAIDCFQHVSSEHVLYQKSNALLGRCFFEIGRFDLAQQIFQRLMIHCKKSSRFFTNQIRFSNACSQILNGNLQSGIRLLEQIYASQVTFPCLQNMLSYYKSFHFDDGRSPFLTAFYFKDRFFPCTFYHSSIFDHYEDSSKNACLFTLNYKAMQHILSSHYQLARVEFISILQQAPSYVPAKFNLCLLNILMDNIPDAQRLLDTLRDYKNLEVLASLFQSFIDLKKNKISSALTSLKDLASSFQTPEYFLHYSSCFLLNKDISASLSPLKDSCNVAILFPFIQRLHAYLEINSLDITYWLSPLSFSFNSLLKRFYT